MDDARRVGGTECVPDLLQHRVRDGGARHAAGLHEGREALALHELHRDPRRLRPLVDARGHHPHDVAAPDPPRDPRVRFAHGYYQTTINATVVAP